MSINTKGERTFITQGDANSTPDEKPVLPVQIRGKVWYSVPYLGHVNSWLTGDQRKTILTLVVGTLGVYALYMIASGTHWPCALATRTGASHKDPHQTIQLTPQIRKQLGRRKMVCTMAGNDSSLRQRFSGAQLPRIRALLSSVWCSESAR